MVTNATAKKGTTKPRRDWTKRFLDRLTEIGIVTDACLAAGINRNTAYVRRRADTGFATAWDDAVETAIGGMEVEARRRAIDGSDVLLMFLLKALRPEMYRQAKGEVHIHNEAPAHPGAARAALAAGKAASLGIKAV